MRLATHPGQFGSRSRYQWANVLSSRYQWASGLSSRYQRASGLSSRYQWANGLSSWYQWASGLASRYEWASGLSIQSIDSVNSWQRKNAIELPKRQIPSEFCQRLPAPPVCLTLSACAARFAHRARDSAFKNGNYSWHFHSAVTHRQG